MKIPEYLEPNFEPQKATVLELIRYLSAHDIPLPNARQRKQFYINLFEEHIAAQRETLISHLGGMHSGMLLDKSPSKDSGTLRL